MRYLAFASAAALIASSAAAQNVTIHGRLNTSLERQKDGDTSMTKLQNNSSRLGFRGKEDLGGGLNAGFELEGGFDSSTGAGQLFNFNRQAELYLSSNRFGTLRMGKFTSEAYYATADYISMHNHDTGTSSDALYAYFPANSKDSDKIAYRAPQLLPGLTLEIAKALKEDDPDDTWDFAANYSIGKLALGAGFSQTDDARQTALRALYPFGNLVVGAYVQRDRDLERQSRNNFRIAAMYQHNASEFHINFGKAGERGDLADSDAIQYTLAYNYNLSKRTKLYTFFTKVDNGAAASYYSSAPGDDFSSLAVGMRHNF